MFEGDQGRALLTETARRLRSGVFLQTVQTDFAIYKRGDPVHVKVEVRNASREPRSVQCDIEFVSIPEDSSRAPLHRETQSMTVPAHATQGLECSWQVPESSADFVQFRVALKSNDIVADRMVSGFCVYDDGVVARGTRVRYKDNAYLLESPGRQGVGQGVATPCLFGTDTYANMFGSPVQSPWTWFRDLETMRDNGLHMFENLQFTPPQYEFTEKQWRQIDALIQLSQRFGLPYMAGLLIGHEIVVSDDELRQQAEFCRKFAARFKRVPGLIYYLNGDFRLTLNDMPDIRRLWNEFLRSRYATDDALRRAWGSRPPEVPLGELPLKEAPAQSWYDVRARDVALFKTQLMKRWIGALCQAIRQEDPDHPITSEYYQRPYSGIDLRLTVSDMDAANFGYFDVPKMDTARLMAAIKWNDMRLAGKTVNIGEFGVKTHEAWSVDRGATEYHIRRTDDERNQLFWWMVHAAWAMGVTKIQNWCWSDDTDNIFPWGIAWNNPLRPKPVLKLYRNLRLLGDHIESTYRPADVVMVMPDTWRLGAPEFSSHALLMNALECLLACNVPFDVANESQLAQLADKPPRLVIMPFAYALSDETLDQLMRLAEQGSRVYLSGDPSIARDGRRQPARLESLFCVHFERESIHASGLPLAEVTAVDAKQIENPSKRLIYQRVRGAGTLFWSPEPWEAFTGHDLFVKEPELTADAQNNFYLSLMSLASVDVPVRVQADRGVWRATLTASGRNRLITLFPRSTSGQGGGQGVATPCLTEPASVTITLGPLQIQFVARLAVPALVLLDPQGRPLLATGSGSLSINGERIAEGDGAWTLTSLDNQPLRTSQRLLLSSTAAEKVTWRSQTPDLNASMVEYQNGRLQPIASIPLRRGDDAWEIPTSPNELYWVGPTAHLNPHVTPW